MIAACVVAYIGDEEVAQVNIAVNVEAHYHAVRDAVMGIKGVDRVEIIAPNRRKVVYVLRRDDESLFPVWQKGGSDA